MRAATTSSHVRERPGWPRCGIVDALRGRRSRRFPVGREIADGPLGLGFRFDMDPSWRLPNPTGRDGVLTPS